MFGKYVFVTYSFKLQAHDLVFTCTTNWGLFLFSSEPASSDSNERVEEHLSWQPLSHSFFFYSSFNKSLFYSFMKQMFDQGCIV